MPNPHYITFPVSGVCGSKLVNTRNEPHATPKQAKPNKHKQSKQTQQTPQKNTEKIDSSSSSSGTECSDDDVSHASTRSTRSSVRKSEEEEEEAAAAKVDNSTKIAKSVKRKKKKKSKTGLYQCKLCDWGNDDGEAFVNHSIISHSTRLSICRVEGCYKSYTSQNGLRNHCKTIHEDALKCGLCNFVSLSPGGAEDHKLSHSNKGKLECQGCKKSFTRANDRDKHWRNTCPKNPDRYIKCKHCLHATGGDEKKSEVRGAEAGLMNHLMDVHHLRGEHLCQFCHRLFSTLSKLNKHNEKCTRTEPNRPLEKM